MHVGFTMMNTVAEPPPAELARALEDRGFESLWTGEHSHIPVARATPYPAGGDLPSPYLEMMNPFVGLAVAATATTDLRVGTSVALPLEHDVFDLAKTVATVDRLSGGRFELGVGVGWNREELANHRPVPWGARYRALAECVGALRSLWCDEQSSFHGEHFDFDPVWSLPKPLQHPHPPVLCGMSGRLGTRQAVAWADAWMPMDVGLGDVTHKVGLFRDAVRGAGRDPLPITMVCWGDPDLDTLTAYRRLGVERVVLGSGRAGWADPASITPFLDRYARVIPKLA